MEISQEQILSHDNATYLIKEYTEPGFFWPRHYHSEIELGYINEGYGKLYAGDLVIDFQKGDLFMIASNRSHAFKTSKDYADNYPFAKLTCVVFQRGFLGESFLLQKETRQLNELLKRLELGVVHFRPDDAFQQQLTHLLQTDGLEGVSVLLRILDTLARDKNAKLISSEAVAPKYYLKPSKDNRLQQVISYMNENFTRDITSAEAARIAGMSGSAFSRFFKLWTEKTFSEALCAMRVAHAQKLLLEISESIAEISRECGYQNLAYFNRQFKRVSKVTPAGFRKEHK